MDALPQDEDPRITKLKEQLYRIHATVCPGLDMPPSVESIASDILGSFTCLRYSRDNHKKRADDYAKFKSFVHDTLDNYGVPGDPDPQGTRSHGCRISGRLNWLYAAWKDQAAH